MRARSVALIMSERMGAINGQSFFRWGNNIEGQSRPGVYSLQIQFVPSAVARVT